MTARTLKDMTTRGQPTKDLSGREPGRVTVNGKQYPLSEDQNVIEFLTDIGFGKRRVIVERNGEPLPADRLQATEVADGDSFEVAQLVGGG